MLRRKRPRAVAEFDESDQRLGSVVPAKAGVQKVSRYWMPAFAGMICLLRSGGLFNCQTPTNPPVAGRGRFVGEAGFGSR